MTEYYFVVVQMTKINAQVLRFFSFEHVKISKDKCIDFYHLHAHQQNHIIHTQYQGNNNGMYLF